MISARPLSLLLYGLASRAAFPLASAYLRSRARRGREDPARLGERLGRASLRRPAGRLVWMHAVSVGESLSLLPLIERMLAERIDISVLATTGTRAAAELLAPRLPPGAVHQFAPIDAPTAVARFLDHWRPELGILVESELWPHLILGAKERGAKLALVSARMSERSVAGWRKAEGAARTVLGAFDLILARSDADAARFRALGARIDGLIDLKFGALPLAADPAELARLRRAMGGRAVIAATSTHAGEDRLFLGRFAALAKRSEAPPLLILAPRHPDRAGEIEGLALSMGFSTARRSARGDPSGAQVYIADTFGELGLWYRLAGLAVVGGSFVAGIGGHNPLEPARLECPFVAGAHVEAWPIYADLRAAKAYGLIEEPADLDRFLQAAIDDPGHFASMRREARRFVAMRDASAQVSIDRILELAAS